jgi:hypothetical protein
LRVKSALYDPIPRVQSLAHQFEPDALAPRPELLNSELVLNPGSDRSPAAVSLDRETLLAMFDGIRQFARGGRRAPHKPLLLLYALGRLKHDRQAEIRFNTTEAALQPLLRVYGPWGASARVSYPYSRLASDGLWQLPDRADLFDAGGNISGRGSRESVTRPLASPPMCWRHSSGSLS